MSDIGELDGFIAELNLRERDADGMIMVSAGEVGYWLKVARSVYVAAYTANASQTHDLLWVRLAARQVPGWWKVEWACSCAVIGSRRISALETINRALVIGRKAQREHARRIAKRKERAAARVR